MPQYWINFEGRQHGPLSLDEVKELKPDSSAYAWFTGLDNWVRITQVPELSELVVGEVEEPQSAGELTMAIPELPTDNQAPEIPQAPPALRPTAIEPIDRVNPALPQEAPELPKLKKRSDATEVDASATAPSNLGWAIAATILCCLPLGVVAIFFAIKTMRYNRNGDTALAQKWSDRTAWLIIASIIFGIISQPFRSLITLLM